MRRALRPGGRLAAIVYSTPDRNEFFSVPVSIIRDRAQLPPPQPGQPGPFSLGGPGVLEAALTAAGFSDVTRRHRSRPAPAAVGGGMRPVRAGVVRGAAPDAGRGGAGRAAGGLGRRSRPPSPGSRPPTASSAPASSSWARAPSEGTKDLAGRSRSSARDQLSGGVASGGMVRLAAVCAELTGSHGIFMGVSQVPAGLRSSAHVHTNCESALFVASGRGRFLVGSRLEKSFDVEAGDFLYIPPDAPHVVVNDGDVDLVLVVARNTQEERVAEYDPEPGNTVPGQVRHCRCAIPLLTKRCKTVPRSDPGPGCSRVPAAGDRAVPEESPALQPVRVEDQRHRRPGGDRPVRRYPGSTALAHDGSSAELLGVLRRFFHVAAQVAYHHYGMVDRFLGDGLLVFFNVPAPRITHSEDALRTALDIAKVLRDAPLGWGSGSRPAWPWSGTSAWVTCATSPASANRSTWPPGSRRSPDPGRSWSGRPPGARPPDLVETGGIPDETETAELKGVGTMTIRRLVVSKTVPPLATRAR